MQKFENGYGDGQIPSWRYFHGRTFFFFLKGGCCKRTPELNKSASGSRCGVASMCTQSAEFARSGRKLFPFWQMIPDAGTKRQVQSLPLSARFWKRAGSQARPVSGKTPDDSAILDGALFNKAQTVDSFSEIPKCKHGRKRLALAQRKHGERHHNRFCQESQVSVDQKEKNSWVRGRWIFWFVFCLRMFFSHSVFLCEGIRPPCEIGAEILGHRASVVCPRFAAT